MFRAYSVFWYYLAILARKKALNATLIILRINIKLILHCMSVCTRNVEDT
jgi:hypothetical protein